MIIDGRIDNKNDKLNQYSEHDAETSGHILLFHVLKHRMDSGALLKLLIFELEIAASQEDAHVVAVEMAERLFEVDCPVFIVVGQIAC